MTDPQRDLLPPDNAELSALLDNAAAIDLRVWPRTLAELVDVYVAFFSRSGLDAAAALTQAKRIIIVLAHHLGGKMIYLPQDEKLNVALRDVEIWRNPDGLNIHALAVRYELTARQIYAIICEQRAISRGRTST